MKNMIRKIAAVGAGAGMVLSTMGGALAADLGSLPGPMVSDAGQYVNTAMVIGSAEDASARTTLQTYFDGSVAVSAGLGSQIATEKIKLQNNIATSSGLDTVYDDSDSAIFADAEVSVGGTSYDYHTELQLTGTANNLDMETSLTSTDDKYELDPKLEIRKDAIRYCYVFDESINVSKQVSTSNPFDMMFLGKQIRIDTVSDNDTFVAQVGDSWSGHPGEVFSGNGITMEILSVDGESAIVDFGGDQRSVSESGTISKGEVDIYLDSAIAGVGSASEAVATFIIGEDARLTVNSGDKYTEYCSPADGHGDPDCDKNNPDWVWNFDQLLMSTSGASNDICVENDFEAYNYNKDPAGLGEYYGLPGGFIYVGADDVSVADSDYMELEFYTEAGNTEDLSNGGNYPTSAIVLTITASETEGIVLDMSGFNATALSADTKTNEVFMWTNSTHSAANTTLVFYKDSNNAVQHAGNITNDAAAGINWGYINYKNTKATDLLLSTYGTPYTDDGTYVGIVPATAESANDNLWFRIQSTGAATGDYLGFGITEDAESNEVVWGSTTTPDATAGTDNVLVGAKKYDLLTGYGLKVMNTDSAGDSDDFIVKVPGDQVKANVAVYEGGSAGAVVSADLISATESVAAYTNLVLVGGPCVNSVTAEYMGLTFPACGTASGIAQDKAVLQMIEKSGKMALVVAGWEKADTQRAASKVAAGGLTGSSIIVE